jgi:hypothetical protein
MTRQDFQLIAGVIKENRERSNSEELFRCDEIAKTFATELAATNPNFKRALFLRACGVAS